MLAGLCPRCRDTVGSRQAETPALMEQVFQLGRQVGKATRQICQVVLNIVEKQSQKRESQGQGEAILIGCLGM